MLTEVWILNVFITIYAPLKSTPKLTWIYLIVKNKTNTFGHSDNQYVWSLFFQRLQTPLHIAVENGYQDTVEILLAGGANLNIREKVCSHHGSKNAIMILHIWVYNIYHNRSKQSNHAKWDNCVRSGVMPAHALFLIIALLLK